MKYIYKAFVLLTVLFTSCETIVTIEIPEQDPKLTVTSFLAENEPFSAFIGSSIHIGKSKEPGPVNNATVAIYEDGVEIEILSLVSNGDYVGIKTPKYGKLYQIQVSAPGFNTVTSEEKLVTPVPVTSVTFKDSATVNDYGEIMAEIKVVFNDPADAKNFYRIMLEHDFYVTDPFTGDTLTINKEKVYFTTNDPSVEHQYYSDAIFFNDKLFNGKTKEFRILISSYFARISKDFYLKFLTCSESYYQFSYTKFKQSYTNGDPFSQPTQVYSNVNGGYGVLGSYSVKEFKISK
jgi:hypothetical protein